ncbi:unnamed protein product, partial [Oikopleura dioica]
STREMTSSRVVWGEFMKIKTFFTFCFLSRNSVSARSAAMSFDFLGQRWWAVNDNVMGGVSAGYVEKIDNMLKFYGQLSSDFNGGFASCRTRFEPGSLAGFDGIQINVKGSARDFQARFHPVESAAYGRYVQGSYTANFKASPEWSTVRIPFASTEYSWRGRRPSGMPEIDPAQLKGMGFLIADKIFDSSFELFVDSISGYKNE